MSLRERFALNPLTIKQWKRFRSIKRGYYSAVLLLIAIVLSFGAELFVNSRALIVSYDGELYFPTYGDIIPGRTFGLGYDYKTDYRELDRLFEGAWQRKLGHDATRTLRRAGERPETRGVPALRAVRGERPLSRHGFDRGATCWRG